MAGISAGYDDFEDAYEIGIKHNLSASARAVVPDRNREGAGG